LSNHVAHEVHLFGLALELHHHLINPLDVHVLRGHLHGLGDAGHGLGHLLRRVHSAHLELNALQIGLHFHEFCLVLTVADEILGHDFDRTHLALLGSGFDVHHGLLFLALESIFLTIELAAGFTNQLFVFFLLLFESQRDFFLAGENFGETHCDI
jgi:hypothetical protein